MNILRLSAIVCAMGAALLAASVTFAYTPVYLQGPAFYSSDWVVEHATPYGYSTAWHSGRDGSRVNLAAVAAIAPRSRGYGEASTTARADFRNATPLAYGQQMLRSKNLAERR